MKCHMEKIGIVILNYQTWELSLACIDSVHRTCSNLSYVIYLVDNASKRPMTDAVRKHLFVEKRVKLLQAKENRGYAAGNNIGIKTALIDQCNVIIVTNNDILFQKQAVEKMAAYLAAHPKTGIVGPKVVDHKGQVLQSCCSMRTGIKEIFQFYTVAKWLFYKKWKTYNCLGQETGKPADVYHVSGCCFAISQECAQKVLPLDEGTMLYYEEPILGICMERAGYVTSYEPGSIVVHKHGATTKQNRPLMYQYISQSELYYCGKYLQAKKWQLCLLYSYRRLLYLLRSLTDHELRSYWRTFQKETSNTYRLEKSRLLTAGKMELKVQRTKCTGEMK